MVMNSINGLNKVEIRANDAHGMAASKALLSLRRCPQFVVRTFFSSEIIPHVIGHWSHKKNRVKRTLH